MHCEHQQIGTQGHAVPNESVISQFFEIVDNHLQEKPEGLIGVHCTHGINRTGYLICRYLIDQLDWSPEEAIKAFGEARGHKIERENYINDLKFGKN